MAQTTPGCLNGLQRMSGMKTMHGLKQELKGTCSDCKSLLEQVLERHFLDSHTFDSYTVKLHIFRFAAKPHMSTE